METIESKFNIRETVNAIRRDREELERALAKFRHSSAPVVTDMKLLPQIYEWFRELSDVENGQMVRSIYGLFPETVCGGALSVERRRQFIFAILYLYAPRRLFSGNMPKGLRRAIANVLGISCHSVISDNANDVLKRYEIYKVWAEDVGNIITSIIARLQAGSPQDVLAYNICEKDKDNR